PQPDVQPVSLRVLWPRAPRRLPREHRQRGGEVGDPAGGHPGHDGPIHELPPRLRPWAVGDRRAGVETRRLPRVPGRDGPDRRAVELPAGRASALQRVSLHAGEGGGARVANESSAAARARFTTRGRAVTPTPESVATSQSLGPPRTNDNSGIRG